MIQWLGDDVMAQRQCSGSATMQWLSDIMRLSGDARLNSNNIISLSSKQGSKH
jgi:hypothetical protein